MTIEEQFFRGLLSWLPSDAVGGRTIKGRTISYGKEVSKCARLDFSSSLLSY